MEFLIWFTAPEGEPRDVSDCLAKAGKITDELAREGKLRCGAPLAPASDGALVRVRDGKAFVSDGPFPEAKEVVAGFWIVDVASRDEAIAIASRSPQAAYGIVEVHPVDFRLTYTDKEEGTPFLFAFRREEGLEDPDKAKLKEMIAFSDALASQGMLIETAPLAPEPQPARVEVRRGETFVSDGPFAEAKEAVGGYGVVRVKDRAAAIALAKRYPHARWGPVELREILFFDPV